MDKIMAVIGLLFFIALIVGLIKPGVVSAREEGSILYNIIHGDSGSSQPSPPSAPLDSETEIQSYAVQLFEKVTDSKANWGSDLRKVRGVKASKVSDKKYSLLIDFRINDNLGSRLRKRGIFSDIKDFAEAVNTDKPLENVDKFLFQGFFPLQDNYGNAKEEIVASVTMSKALIKKINWGNMFSEQLMSLLSSEGNLRMHPAME